MSKPIRLLDSAPSSPAAALFRAALAERTPQRLPQRIMAGLGVSAAANATAAAAAAGTSSLTAGTLLATAKWLVVGMAGGVLLAAGASTAFAPRQVPAGHAVSTTRAPAEPVATFVSVEQNGPVPQPARVEPEQWSAPPDRQASSAAAAVAPVSSLDAGPGEPPPSSQLARELGLISAARHALASGDAAGALRELSEYQALATTGVLEREASVLRIESFAKLGDLTRAKQLATAYARQFPRDAYGPRLQALLQGDAPGGSVEPAGDTHHGRSPTR